MQTPAVTQQLVALIPSIRERRAEIDRTRRIPPDLLAAIRETKVFALEVPSALDGFEAEPAEILQAIETASRGDGSVGWCVGLGVISNGAAGYMKDSGARKVFTDPSAPTAGIFAPSGAAVRVDGGVRVNGKWQFASGIEHSAWVWGGCLVMVDGKPNMTPHGPEIVYAWMPKSLVEVHDTWFVSGLRGTGSNDVSAQDVFVPDDHLFTIGGPGVEATPPLNRMPPVGWFVSHIAAVGLGIARAALDEFHELAQSKVPTFSASVLAEKPVAQVEVARAEAALGGARAFFYQSVADVWRAVGSGAAPSIRETALLRVAALNVAEVGASITRTLSTISGGTAVFASSALQRHALDADALAHHFSVSPHVWEDAGRVFMGRAPLAPMF